MKILKKRRKIGGVSKLSRVPLGKSVAVGYTDSEAELLKMDGRSQAMADPFDGEYASIGGALGVYAPIQPEFDLQKMCHMVTISNILRQCVDAMVTNTTAYGHELEYIGPEGEEANDDQQVERKKILNLLTRPSPGETLRVIAERFQHDKEVLGYRTMEAIRNDDNEVISFNHIPAITMRKTRQERRPTQYAETYFDFEADEWTDRIVTRRFRRYVQHTGLDVVYFKEFGDPRNISCKDGKVIPDAEVAEREEELATEIIWDEFYTPGNSYGQPRWMGVVASILSSRESELVNLNFFRENAIPAMAVLVSGGALTAESYENLVQYITAVRGKDAMQRVMVLEAAADEDSGSITGTPPSPKIDMKPMVNDRQQDGLFKDLDSHNIVKVRSSFRLPPILVGKAEDYTRASALASIQTAENQVFAPERSYMDSIIQMILDTLQVRFWRFKSLGPATTDAEELAKIINALGDQGALTPNVVIKLAKKVLGVYIEPITEEWGDYPFSVIEGLLEKGATIKGLTSFIEKAAPVLVAPVAANGNAKPPASRDALRSSVKRQRERRKLRQAIGRVQSLQAA